MSDTVVDNNINNINNTNHNKKKPKKKNSILQNADDGTVTLSSIGVGILIGLIIFMALEKWKH